MRAHGKLLLTGEYFVLDGALALALPVRYGQDLSVVSLPHANNEIHWESRDEQGAVWFSGAWRQEGAALHHLQSTDDPTAERLEQLLRAARKQRPDAWQSLGGSLIKTAVDFPRSWGLGTSSTLVSLLARQTGVDPYRLLADTFGGSGYDIACATAQGPILYQRNGTEVQVEEVDWAPAFTDQIHFVYLGQKQNSREGIRHYRELGGTQPTLIDEVTALTEAFLAASTLIEVQKVAAAHEDFISEVLQMPRVQEERFADFPGVVKSLGAWGGDFVMVLSDWPTARLRDYMADKGCPVVFSCAAMALP